MQEDSLSPVCVGTLFEPTVYKQFSIFPISFSGPFYCAETW